MVLFASFTWLETGALFALCCVAYMIVLVVYRLWFSPIAHFPGPFLAKVTFWYEFYHTYIRLGKYYLKINEMHHKYGPIVRVTPNELHVAEASFYHELFVTGAKRKTENYPRFSTGSGFEDMTAVSTKHDAHRRARAPLDLFFSRASITRVEPRVLARVQKLCDRIHGFQHTGKPVNLTYALSSLTTDTISSVIFEEPSDYLGDPEFNQEWFDILKKGTCSVPLFAHAPWLTRLLTTPLLRYLTEEFTSWRVWDDKARRQILATKRRPADEAMTRDDTTVFDHLVHSDVPESLFGHGGFPRLAQLIQQAGAHNVSFSLGTILVYVLSSDRMKESLQLELAPLFANPEETPTWRELEKLPYLSAVIREGLRMAIGGMNRTPRVSPDLELQFNEWVIPKMTPVSMSTYWMHNDPDVFPNPFQFRPERWLGDPAKLKHMHSHFVPFSKGSRNCVGQNLVYMQMYHTLAQLFRPGAPELALYNTDSSDVIAVHGLMFPMPRLDSKGIRALVL